MPTSPRGQAGHSRPSTAGPTPQRPPEPGPARHAPSSPRPATPGTHSLSTPPAHRTAGTLSAAGSAELLAVTIGTGSKPSESASRASLPRRRPAGQGVDHDDAQNDNRPRRSSGVRGTVDRGIALE